MEVIRPRVPLTEGFNPDGSTRVMGRTVTRMFADSDSWVRAGGEPFETGYDEDGVCVSTPHPDSIPTPLFNLRRAFGLDGFTGESS